MAGDFHLSTIPSLLSHFSLLFLLYLSHLIHWNSFTLPTFSHFLEELITVTGGLITMAKCYLAAIERRTAVFLTILS